MKNKILSLIGLTAFAVMLHAPQAHAAKMALTPADATFKTGCRSVLNIVLNTEGADTNAADAFLTYNPDEIEVQGLGAGAIYKAYPGKVISNGIIRLTAFNDSGAFNGRGVLGTIAIKGKPGVTSSEIKFQFSAGSSTDSNVAAMDAHDILNGAYGTKINFTQGGKCTNDVTPPFVDGREPKANDVNVDLDSPVTFTIKDKESGVDLKTVEVLLNGTSYTEGNTAFSSDTNGKGYDITINPIENFPDLTPINVVIKAKDLDGNVMPEVSYVFNEMVNVKDCVPGEVHPAAPTLVSYFIHFIITLILLILALLINAYLYMKGRAYVSPYFKKQTIKSSRK